MEQGSIYDYIDKQIAELLEISLIRRHKKINVSQVIGILVEIEKRIPEIVIDGDELIKYLKKRRPEA